MTKRVTKNVITNVSKQDFDTATADFAAADAQQQQLTGKMDAEITKIREKYADQLSELEKKKTEAFAKVQVYCTENYETLFSKKKSFTTPHGTIGFRTGTPKLKTARGFTWASTLELLKIKLPAYVRKIEEPDKQSLLTDRDKPEIKALLPEVGLMVDQDETFFIDLKKEEAEAN